MRRTIIVLVAAGAFLAGCGGSDETPGQGTLQSTSVVTTPAAADDAPDPYAEWLERAPADAPSLSPDDALVRAILGCGREWPAGTTDAILAEIYADYCP